MFIRYRAFLLFFVLLFTFYLSLSACGKKGDPTLKSYEKPDAPTQLTAIHRESEIILSWNFPRNKDKSIKGFHLLKSSGGEFQEAAFIENDRRSYVDTEFIAGLEYRYKIFAHSLKDVFSNDSNVLVAKPAALDAVPKNLSFTVSHDTLTLTWESAGHGILYNVYKKDKDGAYSLIPLNKEPLKENSFKDTFSSGKAVFYTIRSLAGSAIRDEGPASAELVIDPQDFVPSAPKDLQAVATDINVYLIWKEPAETWIRGYRIYKETNIQEGFVVIGETQTPSFLDNEKATSKRNYRVTALGPSKEGPPVEIKDVAYIKQKKKK